MRKLARRTALLIVFLLALQLLVGVTTALADPGYHVVRPGETLFAIGRLYGVNPYAIASMNGLPNPDYIRIGQVLYVPGYVSYSPPYWGPSYYPPYYGGYWWSGWGWGYPHWGWWGPYWWDP